MSVHRLLYIYLGYRDLDLESVKILLAVVMLLFSGGKKNSSKLVSVPKDPVGTQFIYLCIDG